MTFMIIHSPLPFLDDFSIKTASTEFRCNKGIICHFSPAICELLATDPTISIFYINNNVSKDDFKLFMDIIYDTRLDFHHILSLDSYLVADILTHFGRHDILESYENEKQSYDKGDVSKCLEVIEFKVSHRIPIEQDISYLASIFSKIDISLIDQIEDNILELIICDKQIKVTDNGEIFNAIYRRVERGDLEAQYLYKFVDFVRLSQQDVKRFQNQFNIEYLTPQVWDSMIERALLVTNTSTNVRYSVKCYSEDLHGIFYKMTEDCGENPTNNGLIQIYSSSTKRAPDAMPTRVHSTNYSPSAVIELTDNDGWYSNNSDGQWITFDFCEMKVSLTSYEIKFGYDTNVGYKSPQQWVLEGSNDEKIWIELDKRCEQFRPYQIVHFILNEQCKPFQYIRIRQDKSWWGGHFYMGMCNVEFYGDVC